MKLAIRKHLQPRTRPRRVSDNYVPPFPSTVALLLAMRKAIGDGILRYDALPRLRNALSTALGNDSPRRIPALGSCAVC